MSIQIQAIKVNKEKGTISGTFHIERGGGHIGGKLSATIVLEDMTPLNLASINELAGSLAKEIIYQICECVINQ